MENNEQPTKDQEDTKLSAPYIREQFDQVLKSFGREKSEPT